MYGTKVGDNDVAVKLGRLLRDYKECIGALEVLKELLDDEPHNLGLAESALREKAERGIREALAGALASNEGELLDILLRVQELRD